MFTKNHDNITDSKKMSLGQSNKVKHQLARPEPNVDRKLISRSASSRQLTTNWETFIGC